MTWPYLKPVIYHTKQQTRILWYDLTRSQTRDLSHEAANTNSIVFDTSIVCFAILVLPVLLDEEYWSFQYCVFYNTSITSFAGWRILELPVLCVLQYLYYQYCWMKNTRVSSTVCFTILVLPVLLNEEYWSFQYRVFYNTSITSMVGWRILELPVLCIDQRFWYSNIVNARYWYIGISSIVIVL